MADGIMIQAEESRLREFRVRPALADSGTDRKTAGQQSFATPHHRDTLSGHADSIPVPTAGLACPHLG